MAELMSGMPLLPLLPGAVVKFEAINPVTGAAVSGVTVAQAVLYATVPAAEASSGTIDIGPMMFVPGPTPVAAAPVKVTKKGGL